MARRWRRQGQAMSRIVPPVLRGAAHYAADRGAYLARDLTKAKIQSVGLGRLAGAVGATSSKRKRGYTQTGNAWGAVYARGPTAGRGNQALLAYSEGASIYPVRGKWLAFATDAIPTRVGRKKMTPALYRSSGLMQSIGKLVFVPGKNAREAFLIARNVTKSKRNGRIKAYAGRTPRGSTRERGVVAFVLIKFTRRAQRWRQADIMRRAQAQQPVFAAEYIAGARQRGGPGV